MLKYKKAFIWTAAVVVTMSAAVYQRLTGPTYPQKHKIEINKKKYTLKLLRTFGGDDDATIELNIPDTSVNAEIFYKNYPEIENQNWISVDFQRELKDQKSILSVNLPHQPPAGKLMYYLEISSNSKKSVVLKNNPVVIRFKGSVPTPILIPHIFFMFFAMLWANAAGLFATFKMPQMKLYTKITFVLILLGGMIFGPIVQKYAFGELWTGVPFGWDLTDNKTLIGFIVWSFALVLNLKKENRFAIIAAALITLIIFSIPHSMFGSELNRETGKVTQGYIFMLPFFAYFQTKFRIKKDEV